MRAVAVFGISHLWFCDQDAGQCYTTSKGIATVVVVSGVLAFAAAKGGGGHGHGGGGGGGGVNRGGVGFVEVEVDDISYEMDERDV